MQSAQFFFFISLLKIFLLHSLRWPTNRFAVCAVLMRNSRNVECVLSDPIAFLMFLIVDHNWLRSTHWFRCIRKKHDYKAMSNRLGLIGGVATNQQAVKIASLFMTYSVHEDFALPDHRLYGSRSINKCSTSVVYTIMILNWNYNLLWHVSERINFSAPAKPFEYDVHSIHKTLFLSRKHDGWCWCLGCWFFLLFFGFIDSHSPFNSLRFISSTSIISRAPQGIKIVNLKCSLINREMVGESRGCGVDENRFNFHMSRHMTLDKCR